METVTLEQRRRFSAEKMQKCSLFDSDKCFIDQYCLLPGQAQKIHSHASEDKVYIVLVGEAVCHVAGEEQVLKAGEACIARATEAHGIRNDSDENVVALVVMAPRPAPKA